jgi:putative endonuclease
VRNVQQRYYFVYIMASKRRTLYTGVTGNLEGRVIRHKSRLFAGFASKHNCTRLVYFEEFTDASQAIAREKQIKGWRRAKKIWLIEQMNPAWDDLMPDVVIPDGLKREDIDGW